MKTRTALVMVWLLLGPVCFGAEPTASNNSPRIATLSELTKPAKQIPFKEVVRATTHHRILDFDTNNTAHVALRSRILKAATLAGERARQEGLSAARANEAGNQMEAFVKAALKEVGLPARTPLNTAGKAQTTGYPDLEIPSTVPCYLELKTYNAATANTTQRTFYYSPSETPKVTCDALHLLLAFQLERQERGGKVIFMPVHWKLISLQELRVNLKFEFNQSNRGLYGKEAATSLLVEAKIQ